MGLKERTGLCKTKYINDSSFHSHSHINWCGVNGRTRIKSSTSVRSSSHIQKDLCTSPLAVILFKADWNTSFNFHLVYSIIVYILLKSENKTRTPTAQTPGNSGDRMQKLSIQSAMHCDGWHDSILCHTKYTQT